VGALFASYSLTAIIQICGPLTHSPWLNPNNFRQWYVCLLPFVALQPLVGAVTASWSRRAGGSLREQLIAALAPAIPFIALMLFSVVVTLPVEVVWVAMHPSLHINGRGILLKMAFSTWTLLPALALLIGAAPFLRRPQPQS
jgi:hypothetical protein